MFSPLRRRAAVLLLVAGIMVPAIAAPALALRPARPGSTVDEQQGEGAPEEESDPTEAPNAPEGSGPNRPLPPGSGVDEQEVEDGHAPTPESPFRVLLEVEVDEPFVLAKVELVQLQDIADDRTPTELWIDFGNGDRHSRDLSSGIPQPWMVQRRYPTDQERTYRVMAWVNDSAGGVSSASQTVDVEVLYDVTLTTIEFAPVFNDCDLTFLRGKGDFTFDYDMPWREQNFSDHFSFKLDDGEDKVLPINVVAEGVTATNYPRMIIDWDEHDGIIDPGALTPSFDPRLRWEYLRPTPDDATRVRSIRDEKDGCHVQLTFTYETTRHTGVALGS